MEWLSGLLNLALYRGKGLWDKQQGALLMLSMGSNHTPLTGERYHPATKPPALDTTLLMEA